MQGLKWNDFFWALSEVQAINFIAPQKNLLYRLQYNTKEGEKGQEKLWNLKFNALEENSFRDETVKDSLAKYLTDLMMDVIGIKSGAFNLFLINSSDEIFKSLIIIWSDKDVAKTSITNERLLFFKEFLEYYGGNKVPTILPWKYLREKIKEENNSIDFSGRTLEFPLKFNGDSKKVDIAEYQLLLRTNGRFKVKNVSTGEVAMGKFDSDIIVSSEEFFEEFYHSFPPYIA